MGDLDNRIGEVGGRGGWQATIFSPCAVDLRSAESILLGVETQLTPDQTALIRDAVASGRLNRPEDALQEGLMLWEERRAQKIGNLRHYRALERFPGER